MLIVHVFFHVKPEQVEAFKKASMDNAQNSRKETGIVQFDVLQQQDDESRFLFIEIFRTPDDQLKHRETEHYKKWRQSIANMLVEPYSIIKYNDIISDQ